MARAKVWCEITCGCCGILIADSTYYTNPSTISKLKKIANEDGWIWDEERSMNLCPECQEELKKEKSDTEGGIDIFDAWEATKNS